MSINSQGALLKVVPVTVHGRHGPIKTHALLDEGATVSLIDASLAQDLGVDGQSEILNINGIGSSKQTIKTKHVTVTIENSTHSQYDIGLMTMANLNLQCQYLDRSKLVSYSHVREVEHMIHWYSEASPKILIGQDNWHLIVTRKLYSGGKNEPVVSETLLGMVVHGSKGARNESSHFCAHISANEDLHELVKSSFELESIGITTKDRVNTMEDKAIDILNNTTKRINENTWETGLLWANEDVKLPDSKQLALKRFYNLETKLKKDKKLALDYSQQINRLIELGFAEEFDESNGSKDVGWFLPHFAVINPNKPGKVRLVFDCAAKSQGVSLNDHLLTGPDLLQSLLGVLWQFRQGPVAMAADIKDMFLKIKIRKDDQKYQKFYWRELGDESPPKTYIMTSMLFGATCSPSTAIHVKNTNALEFLQVYPEAVRAIENNHYVDDYLGSCASETEAIEMAHNVIKIHEKGAFDICNWASNSKEVMQSIPEEKRSKGNIEITPEAAVKEKTLGTYDVGTIR